MTFYLKVSVSIFHVLTRSISVSIMYFIFVGWHRCLQNTNTSKNISVHTYNTHENARKDIKYSLHIFVDDEEEAGQIN